MNELNHLLCFYFLTISKVCFHDGFAQSLISKQYINNPCDAGQCDLDGNLAKQAVTFCLQNINKCTNKKSYIPRQSEYFRLLGICICAINYCIILFPGCKNIITVTFELQSFICFN